MGLISPLLAYSGIKDLLIHFILVSIMFDTGFSGSNIEIESSRSVRKFNITTINIWVVFVTIIIHYIHNNVISSISMNT